MITVDAHIDDLRPELIRLRLFGSTFDGTQQSIPEMLSLAKLVKVGFVIVS
jgi:hypothetical protein